MIQAIELAERGVGIGVGRAGDGHHRRELGVAERGEAADDRGDDEREHQRRPRARPLRVAGGGGADRREDAGADDRADAERDHVPRAERPLQRVTRLGGLRDEGVEGLPLDELFEKAQVPRRIAGAPRISVRKLPGRAFREMGRPAWEDPPPAAASAVRAPESRGAAVPGWAVEAPAGSRARARVPRGRVFRSSWKWGLQ